MEIIPWIIENRQLITLLFGVFFLFPMLRTPNYNRGELVVCPPNIAIYFWAILIVLVIALTPELSMGGDKINYTKHFLSISSGRSDPTDGKDFLFYVWMKFVTGFTSNPTVFFLLTTIVYVLGYIFAFKRICRNQWSVLMVAAVFNLGFFAYGDNTLRAGMAYSLLLLAISFFSNKKIFAIGLAVMAVCIHHSMVILFSALTIAYFYKNTKVIFLGWIVLLLFSIFLGHTTQEFLAGLFESSDDQRLTSYALGTADGVYKQGFRADFLIYGFVPILLGLIFRYKNRFEDKFYVWILNTYIIANGFWLLMIRAIFTDRFVYLSWGLIPIVLFYPLLKKRIWVNQNQLLVGGLFLILLLDLVLAFRGLFLEAF